MFTHDNWFFGALVKCRCGCFFYNVQQLYRWSVQQALPLRFYIELRDMKECIVLLLEVHCFIIALCSLTDSEASEATFALCTKIPKV